MRGQDKLIAGLIVGAGAMYLLDPDRGARRRSFLRERGSAELRSLLRRVPELQGAGNGLTPTTRLVLGATGGIMALHGVRMKGPGGRALTFLGSGLLSRAAGQVAPRRVVEGSAEAEPSASPVTQEPAVPQHATKSTPKRRRSRR